MPGVTASFQGLSIQAEVVVRTRQGSVTFQAARVSAFGCRGLKWTQPFRPEISLGQKVVATVRSIDTNLAACEVTAVIFREQTPTTQTMGIRFIDEDQQAANRERLRHFISRFGDASEKHVRKFRRFSNREYLGSFPNRCRIFARLAKNAEIVCDTVAIGTNGLQVRSESPQMSSVGFETDLEVILEPRGPVREPLQLQCRVRSIVDDTNVKCGNPVRSLGLQIERMTSLQEANLKKILARIQDEREARRALSLDSD
jgi:hypothetical protein